MSTHSSSQRGFLRSTAALLVLLLAAGASPTGQAEPPAPAATAIVAAGDAARGRYIVENIAMCVECHSQRDANGDIVAGTRFGGGAMPVAPAWARPAWPLRTPRIAGLPGYSDAQALRLLTGGAIGRDGQQLRPPMPRFRMTPEDAADVIAFLRSL